MQPATAALGWVGTAGHLLLPSLIAGMEFAAIYLPLQVVLAHPPNRLSFIQGSSADVIQLPDIQFSRFSESTLHVLSSVRPPGSIFYIPFSKIFRIC